MHRTIKRDPKQLPNPAVAGQAFAKKHGLRYNVTDSAEMTDQHWCELVRAR